MIEELGLAKNLFARPLPWIALDGDELTANVTAFEEPVCEHETRLVVVRFGDDLFEQLG